MNLQCSDISILNIPVFQSYFLLLVTLCYHFVQSYPDSWVQGSRHVHQMPTFPLLRITMGGTYNQLYRGNECCSSRTEAVIKE